MKHSEKKDKNTRKECDLCRIRIHACGECKEKKNYLEENYDQIRVNKIK